MTVRVAFIGSKSLGHRVLRDVIDGLRPSDVLAGAICPDDRADPRSILHAFEPTAAERGIRLAVVPASGSVAAALDELHPDVVIVCGWYHLIQVERWPATAFFGLHAGPLPRYRGHAPIVWQIINGERHIGLTLFRLASGIDDGDIIEQGTVPLGSDDTIADALDRLERDLAPRLVASALPAILAGGAMGRPQDASRATYCARRRPADGAIDWSMSCERVHDFVRAQTFPYPGAFTTLSDGRTLRIWRTEPLPDEAVAAGSIRAHRDGHPVVGCGSGAVRLRSASIDGGPARPLAELVDTTGAGRIALTGALGASRP